MHLALWFVVGWTILSINYFAINYFVSINCNHPSIATINYFAHFPVNVPLSRVPKPSSRPSSVTSIFPLHHRPRFRRTSSPCTVLRVWRLRRATPWPWSDLGAKSSTNFFWNVTQRRSLYGCLRLVSLGLWFLWFSCSLLWRAYCLSALSTCPCAWILNYNTVAVFAE